MADDYPRDAETWERLRWARVRRFETAEAAAESLGVKPGTYRAFERQPGSSKSIRLDHQNAARFAKKFNVRWEWLLLGEGVPWLKDDGGPKGPKARVLEALDETNVERLEVVADAIVALLKAGNRR